MFPRGISCLLYKPQNAYKTFPPCLPIIQLFRFRQLQITTSTVPNALHHFPTPRLKPPILLPPCHNYCTSFEQTNSSNNHKKLLRHLHTPVNTHLTSLYPSIIPLLSNCKPNNKSRFSLLSNNVSPHTPRHTKRLHCAVPRFHSTKSHTPNPPHDTSSSQTIPKGRDFKDEGRLLTQPPLHVCVVGSGPSGMYVTSELLKMQPSIKVGNFVWYT